MKKKHLLLLSTTILTLLFLATSFVSKVEITIKATECTHDNLVHYERKEATCTESGHIEYYVCCDCHNSYYDEACTSLIPNTTYGLSSSLDGRYIAPHTNEDQFKVHREPTINKEGEARKTCSKCHQYVSLPILKLPNVKIMNTYTLYWDKVDNADGYEVSVNGYVHKIGNVTTFTINKNQINYPITVSAYSLLSSYYRWGGTNVELSSTNANIQADKNFDFENRIYTFKANSSWDGRYGNFVNHDWYVYSEDNGNTTGMMTVDSSSSGMVGNILKDLGSGVSKAGTYEIRYRIKLSTEGAKYAANRTIFANINHPTGHYPISPVSLNGMEANRWYDIKTTVTKEATSWQQLIFFYHTSSNEMLTMDDYILVDDIGVYEVGGTVDLDEYEGDFEYFRNRFIGLSTSSGSWMFNRTIYIENNGIGTGIIIEEDNNRALKAYGASDIVAFNLSGSTQLLNAGLYQMTFDIKFTNDTKLTNLSLIGFAMDDIAINETEVTLPSNIGINEYAKVTFNFVTTGQGKDWVNLYFKATMNNANGNANNYFLMDNVEIKLINTINHSGKQTTVASVNEIAYLTGSSATSNTLTNWKIGSTDLGIPVYDYEKEKMYFLFGDTYSGEGEHVREYDWRSNVIGVTTDLDASDGITFDSFLSSTPGYAKEIIGRKGVDHVEVTNIPTGGIIIDGAFYLFHMSVRHWGDSGAWDINYAGVYKSVDEGETWNRVDDLIWTENTTDNIMNLTGLTQSECKRREANNFLQIFPLDGKDGYIYLYGIPGGRFGGVKLMRVLKDKFEQFNEYEYYLGKDSNNNPIFEKGDEARYKTHSSSIGYIIPKDRQVAEVSVVFNSYLNKWLLSTQFRNADICYMSADKPWGEFSDMTLLSSASQYGGIYCAFTHEKYMEDNGKTMYYFMSNWVEYNSTVMKVVFR